MRKKDRLVRIEYEILKNAPSFTPKQISKLSCGLGIESWEMNLAHWALKKENLEEALTALGHTSVSFKAPEELIDITKHNFDVALSFPGEQRTYVESVVAELSPAIPPTNIFYDMFYKSQLARPKLNNLLQDIYRNRSKLIVVFLCSTYEKKEWCGIEFHAIEEIIMSKRHDIIMYVHHDDGKVQGVFKTDGYIDANTHTPKQVAKMIIERVKLALRLTDGDLSYGYRSALRPL